MHVSTYEEEDESKVADFLRTKLVLVFLFVLGYKALQFALKNEAHRTNIGQISL